MPFEAALQGRKGYSNDLSPFASTIARAKVVPPKPDRLAKEIELFSLELASEKVTDDSLSAAEFGLNAAVKDYFHQETLSEILRARQVLNRGVLSLERNYIKACLLHILHGNRPYALSRISHPLTPFAPRGDFEYRSLIEKLRTRCVRLMAMELPPEFIPGTSWNADFRTLSRKIRKPVDAIICSPPFPGFRFDRPNWMRMWFCGWNAEDFHMTSKQYLERQQGTTFGVYNEFFEMVTRVTRPGAPVVLHVGGSRGYEMTEKLKTIGSMHLKYIDTIFEDVSHLEKHGISDKGTTSKHNLLVFQS